MRPQESYQDWLDRVVGILPEGVEPPDDPAEAKARGFVIESDDAANWALRRLAAVEDAHRQRTAFIKAEITRLSDWQADEDAKAARERTFFEGLLRRYLELLREQGKLGRRKSYPLPNGTLGFQARPLDYAVVDGEALLTWACDHNLVRVVYSPEWGDIRRDLHPVAEALGEGAYVEEIDETTGEVLRLPVPGVQVSRLPSEAFHIRLPKEKAEDGA
jgi:uncharacterized small protein (DUF1192 family)